MKRSHEASHSAAQNTRQTHARTHNGTTRPRTATRRKRKRGDGRTRHRANRSSQASVPVRRTPRTRRKVANGVSRKVNGQGILARHRQNIEHEKSNGAANLLSSEREAGNAHRLLVNEDGLCVKCGGWIRREFAIETCMMCNRTRKVAGATKRDMLAQERMDEQLRPTSVETVWQSDDPDDRLSLDRP